MSDYHIRTIAANLKSASAIFHYPVQDTNNLVGTNWRTALVVSQGGADEILSWMSDVSAEELVELKSGAKYEDAVTIKFSSLELTNMQRLAELETEYTARAAAFKARNELTMNFFGKSGDV